MKPDSEERKTKTDAERAAEEEDRRERRRMMKNAGDYSWIGIEFGVGAALGFYSGRWLDERFGTAPWLTMTMVMLGFTVAVRDLYRLAKKYQREESKR